MNRTRGHSAIRDRRGTNNPFRNPSGRRLEGILLRIRYLAILIFLAASVLGRDELSNAEWAALGVVAVLGLAYNGVYDRLRRRRDRLEPAMPFTDQIAIVGLLAAFPQLVAPLLLVLVALGATGTAAFGTRIASRAVALGAVLVIPAVLLQAEDLSTSIGILIVYLVAVTAAVAVVGAISEMERDVRQRYVELMGGIDAVVWEELTRSPSTLYVNQRAEEIFGFAPAEWRRPGFWSDRVHPEDIERVAREYREAIRKGRSCELEYRMIAADGSTVHVRDRMRVETDDMGLAVRVRGVMLDVTHERQARAQAVQYLNLVDRIALALFVLRVEEQPHVDNEGQLVCAAINPEAARLSSVDIQSALDRSASEVLPFADESMLGDLVRVAHTGRNLTFDDLRIHTDSGTIRTYSAYAFPLPDNAVGIALHDVTDRTTAAEVLRRQALHDGLTGLPNRTMLLERLRFAIQRAEGVGNAALLVMDLNQFKEINDTLGHEHGDRLLIEVSRRLRRVASDGDTIARLGGDEFGVLLDPGDVSDAVNTAEAIREALEHPFHLSGIDIQTNAAVGIAVHPEHALDAEQLVQRADVAMYTAKRVSSSFAVYDPAHDQSSLRRLSLLGELRRAIDGDELELHFQPSLDLVSGTVPRAEALVRWRHPEHGLVPPGEFIELAELSGLIEPLSRWVLTAGIRQAGEWARSGLEVGVSLNLSVRNLKEEDLVPWLEQQLRTYALDPALVTLEITESQLMDDPIQAMQVLESVQRLGITTSIDDFGTGHSSLAYLKHLPISELKIDRSFVGNMLAEESDLTIVRSTIDLAHNLGLGVVAEGVEDGPTLGHLAELGCDRAQGYFITEPLEVDTATEWLRDPTNISEAHHHLGLSRSR